MSNIDPQEPVLRLLFSPYHFRKNGMLHAKAFEDKNNNLSLKRLRLTTKEACIKQSHAMSSKEKQAAGICLLCPEKVMNLKKGSLGILIKATPSNNDKAHASLIIVDAELKPIQIKSGEPIVDNDLNELRNSLVNGINNLSLGKMYDEKEFQETPLEELNAFCADKTTPPTTS